MYQYIMPAKLSDRSNVDIVRYESHTKIRPNGFEKRNECGRRNNVLRDDRTLSPKVVVPDAFSIMPLCSVSHGCQLFHSNFVSYLSMIVMIGATRTPALIAAKASVPILSPRFRVFHAFTCVSDALLPGIAFATGGFQARSSA